MSDQNPLDDLIRAQATALGLPLDATWLPAIRMNLEITFRLSKAFDQFPLPDDAEPAPVFEA